MKKIVLSILGVVMGCVAAMAQIGYQVAIIDQSTGKPKANQTVSVVVSLENNAGTTIFSDTQSATTNEFGVVSLQIGNAETFSNMDWSKLPLWVSASVDEVTIGKTQVLNVPVAEHANHWGTLTKKILTSKSWSDGKTGYFTFNNTGLATKFFQGNSGSRKYNYYISGNQIILVAQDDKSYSISFHYISELNALYDIVYREIYK